MPSKSLVTSHTLCNAIHKRMWIHVLLVVLVAGCKPSGENSLVLVKCEHLWHYDDTNRHCYHSQMSNNCICTLYETMLLGYNKFQKTERALRRWHESRFTRSIYTYIIVEELIIKEKETPSYHHILSYVQWLPIP